MDGPPLAERTVNLWRVPVDEALPIATCIMQHGGMVSHERRGGTMSHRCITALFTLIGIVVLVPVGVDGQTLTGAASSWTPPRTAWGDPDLQGCMDRASLLLTALVDRVCSNTRLVFAAAHSQCDIVVKDGVVDLAALESSQAKARKPARPAFRDIRFS